MTKMDLTENFKLEELVYSYTAAVCKIENSPDEATIASLKQLCEGLLQPLRNHIGKPITVLSGYRSKELNSKVGGVVNSQHLAGEAADCTTGDGPEKLLSALRASKLPFDQAILYRERFLHLSYRPGKNRRQVMIR